MRSSYATSGEGLYRVADPLARPADLLERDQVGSLSLASSVRSVRTVQSSGNILCLIRPGEQLDRSALGADHVLADHAADHLHVAEAPDADLLVPVDERLGQLVQVLVVAALRVDLEQRQPALAPQRVEGA
jgi:hypothetical protein